MKAQENIRFPRLNELLSVSLFSQSNLMEGFSDKKALQVIEVCKKHLKYSNNDGEIKHLMNNILIEALARNVGSGENYGFGFPYDFLKKIEHKMASEINEFLIYEIMEWGYGMADHDFITITKNKQEEYFFHSEKAPRELISYQTMSNLAYGAIEKSFNLEYERFQSKVLGIPIKEWSGIISKDETIDKYL